MIAIARNGRMSGKLTGKAVHHMRNLVKALPEAIPPEKGTPELRRYRLLVSETLAALIMHLTQD